MSGGGGHISAMIASLKANDRRKAKRTFGNFISPSRVKKNTLSFKKISEDHKNAIRRKVVIEQQREAGWVIYKVGLSILITLSIIGILVLVLKTIFT